MSIWQSDVVAIHFSRKAVSLHMEIVPHKAKWSHGDVFFCFNVWFTEIWLWLHCLWATKAQTSLRIRYLKSKMTRSDTYVSLFLVGFSMIKFLATPAARQYCALMGCCCVIFFSSENFSRKRNTIKCAAFPGYKLWPSSWTSESAEWGKDFIKRLVNLTRNSFLYFIMSRDMWFPTMWHFDKCRLRHACAASIKA